MAVIIPTPPRLVGDWAVDQESIVDYLQQFSDAVNALIAANTANIAAINTALGNAHVSGFPLTLSTA